MVPRSVRRPAAALAVATIAACRPAGAPAEAQPPAVLTAAAVTGPAADDPPDAEAPEAGADAEAPVAGPDAEAPAPTLPANVTPGDLVRVAAPDGTELVVLHGEAFTRRALVYLHGACGDIEAPRAWARAAARHATLIALEGDRACGSRPGKRYWSGRAWPLDRRIRAAVRLVRSLRGGLLDEAPLAVMGYSNGANAAQELVRRFPERYRRVVLGGSPEQPSVRHLHRARAVAVLAGERELQHGMRTGVRLLELSGVPVRFFELPGVGHGEYGPGAERVLGDALDWLYAERSRDGG